jgi:hypothetical protein
LQGRSRYEKAQDASLLQRYTGTSRPAGRMTADHHDPIEPALDLGLLRDPLLER